MAALARSVSAVFWATAAWRIVSTAEVSASSADAAAEESATDADVALSASPASAPQPARKSRQHPANAQGKTRHTIARAIPHAVLCARIASNLAAIEPPMPSYPSEPSAPARLVLVLKKGIIACLHDERVEPGKKSRQTAVTFAAPNPFTQNQCHIIAWHHMSGKTRRRRCHSELFQGTGASHAT